MDVLKFRYRKLFGLTAKELREETSDEFLTNLYIYAQIQEKGRLEAKHGSS